MKELTFNEIKVIAGGGKCRCIIDGNYSDEGTFPTSKACGNWCCEEQGAEHFRFNYNDQRDCTYRQGSVCAGYVGDHSTPGGSQGQVILGPNFLK